MVGRPPQRRLKLVDRLQSTRPRKLLAIDGGGIRGVLSLAVLARIESLLIAESGRPDYRLADYFDYVAGTSTGGSLPPASPPECQSPTFSRFTSATAPTCSRRRGWSTGSGCWHNTRANRSPSSSGR